MNGDRTDTDNEHVVRINLQDALSEHRGSLISSGWVNDEHVDVFSVKDQFAVVGSNFFALVNSMFDVYQVLD